MPLFPDLSLITVPDNDSFPMDQVPSDGSLKLLVLYEGNLPFLERVLGAAGYDEPQRQLHLIRSEPTDEELLDLTALIHKLEVDKIILFGQDLRKLGLHFIVQKYFPIQVSGRTYMICDSVTEIARAKEKGNSQLAGALWNGIKANFLREKPA